MSGVRYYKTTTRRVGNTTYKTVQSRRWGGPYDQPSAVGGVIVFCLVVGFFFWPIGLNVPTGVKWVLEILWLLALFLLGAAARSRRSAAARPKANAFPKPKRPSGPGNPPSAAPRTLTQTRISDVERTQVTNALSDHFAKGHLDLDELDKRVDHALRAKTRTDLAVALFDLPHGREKLAGEKKDAPPAESRAASPDVRRSPSSLSAETTPGANEKATVPPVRRPAPPGSTAGPRRRPVPPRAPAAPRRPAQSPSSFVPPPFRDMWAQLSDEPFPEIGTPAFAALSQLWKEEFTRLHATAEYEAAVKKDYERLKSAAKRSRPKDQGR